MKYLYIFFIGFVYFLVGCKENEDIIAYDQSKSYIYFAYQDPKKSIESYLKELDYSFVFEKEGTDEKKIAIPVKKTGLPFKKEVEFSYQINAEETTMPEGSYSIQPPIFHADKYVDTLYITVKNVPEIAVEQLRLSISLKNNLNFELADQDLGTFTLNVSNILTQPTWWTTYLKVFGTYYVEVYKQWILIYYQGADPNVNSRNGQAYYWNNMPTSASSLQTSYPVTYYHILKLKEYFEKNIVYPNGDTSKPRILLP